MFGIGKKDEDGKQVRIEHRGKHLRASRTGGVAARAQTRVGPANLTVNTARGVRVSTRLAKGARVAMQNGRMQLIGRWRSGPLGFNVSKSGVSASVKNRAGTFNFIKPQYSSFKVAGVHFRGRRAAEMQMIYMAFVALATVASVLLQALIFTLWLLGVMALTIWEAVAGFVKGYREG